MNGTIETIFFDNYPTRVDGRAPVDDLERVDDRAKAKMAVIEGLRAIVKQTVCSFPLVHSLIYKKKK